MAEAKSNRFTKYFPLLLDALRSADPNPMRPAEAMAWIRAKEEIPADDLTRFVQNGTQSIFENDVHWARFYLVKAGLLGNARRGLWSLTKEGREKRLSQEETWDLYVRIRDANRPGGSQAEEDVPAPGAVGDDGEGKSYWFVGAVWGGTEDQLSRFREQGVWENGYEDQLLDLVRRIRPGDQIAIKASFVKKRVPFDVGGKSVSVMRIKATGTVLDNAGDGRTVKVAWDPPEEPRDWYFYTYRTTIVEADKEAEDGRRLIDFTFRGVPQDYAWFLAQPYWLEKYGVKPATISANTPAAPIDIEPDEEIGEEESPYTIEDIIAEGCFLTNGELAVAARARTAYRPPRLRHRHARRWSRLVVRTEAGTGVMRTANSIACLWQAGRTSAIPSRLALRAPASRLAVLTGCRRPRQGLLKQVRLGGSADAPFPTRHGRCERLRGSCGGLDARLVICTKEWYINT